MNEVDKMHRKDIEDRVEDVKKSLKVSKMDGQTLIDYAWWKYAHG